MRPALIFACLLATSVAAQDQMSGPIAANGTAAKSKASEYPVHAALPNGGFLAAEYLVRSFGGDAGMFTAEDYLVVEVAVFPKGDLLLANSHFTLRLNGKKQALVAQPPQFVSAAIKYDDWERRPTMVGTAGVGDGGVIVGAPGCSPAE
jgi:hypothetical protein